MCRCFSQPTKECLFCLANVENLSGYIVMKLVGQLRKMEENYRGNDTSFRLAVVCRGRNQHELFSHFPNNTHHITGLTVQQMVSCLQHFADVYVVSSNLPGAGKSEYISRKAASKKKSVVLFQVCGPVTKEYLIQKLSALNLEPLEHLLHIDVGQVPTPELVDSFIFELIVLGQSTFGTRTVQLKTKSVAVEIANTLQHDLKNSLMFVSKLRQTYISCHETVSDVQYTRSETCSALQVTCQYLNALEKGLLDKKDIILNDHDTPVSSEDIKWLLQKHIRMHNDMSLTTRDIFLNDLGLQLRKMSMSVFFLQKNLQQMIHTEEPNQVKTLMVRSLVESCQEFASRSVISCRSMQELALNMCQSLKKNEKGDGMNEETEYELNIKLTELMTKRVEGMIRWETSNHFMILFNHDGQSVTALYRYLDKVPQQLKELFEEQLKTPLCDFSKLTHEKLYEILMQLIPAQTSISTAESRVKSSYMLTPDNLHKMALNLLRIQAGIPVIIMGETGCGKTSLVRYLASMWGVELKIVCLHAGFSEERICSITQQLHEKSLEDPTKTTWIFFDEVNACEHLGLLSNIICHHTCNGIVLAENLVFLAACNPYRLKENPIFTAGLKHKVKEDEYSRLVYRVYPLPEAMIDYVWDYGLLHDKDEKKYIEQMVQKVFPAEKLPLKKVEEVIIYSQSFLQTVVERTGECVSLRDVERCLSLGLWFFEEMLPHKDKFLSKNDGVERLQIPSWQRAIILALAHCYHSRINTREKRKQYMECIAYILIGNTTNDDTAIRVVKEEQEELLNRMELPDGIAKNMALQENVFVAFVCIMRQIPVFLVGKPGSSKSLSVQLIKSNLRGGDSTNEYFRELPQLFVVSYQGSETSTSEGIIQAFNKAESYIKNKDHEKVLPVVLLDEVGLAEKSKFNPLKVLHDLLEPVSGQPPNVAVVGISNWALDAAKMNRAIYLSRPDLDEKDLLETATSINRNLHTYKGLDHNHLLKSLSDTFSKYQNTQHMQNFHGLRDYYALIKNISKTIQKRKEQGDNRLFEKPTIIEIAVEGILRNFGGIKRRKNEMMELFMNDNSERDSLKEFDLKELISSNLQDNDARHLMIITKGDSALGILKNVIQKLGRTCETIIGSKFEEDLTEDYSYRILSRIILVMERECVLIMKDLDNIYGCLYDMLNQNYTLVGSKKTCRVALGPLSNSMCRVHDKFRCIVLVDEALVSKADPPFLNRFEKQIVDYEDVLTAQQSDGKKNLEKWVGLFCTVENCHFEPEDCFMGFHEDTLPTLVLQNISSEMSDEDLNHTMKKCQDKLLWTATPSAIVRLHKTSMPMDDIKEITQKYLLRPQHHGLYELLCHLGEKQKMVRELPHYMGDSPLYPQKEHSHKDEYMSLGYDSLGYKVVVYTNSHLTASLEENIDTLKFQMQIERLSSFKTERELTSQVRHYWFSSENDLLLLYCKLSLDSECLQLAMYQIDNVRAEFQQSGNDIYSKKKNVCILVHTDCSSDQPHNGWQFNYLSGWEIVTIDDLQPLENQTVPEILQQSPCEVLRASKTEITSFIKKHTFFAFTCLKSSSYHQNLEKITTMVQSIVTCDHLLKCIAKWIDKNLDAMYRDQARLFQNDGSWHVKVSCDANCLNRSTTFQKTLLHFIERQIKTLLAKIIFRLESLSAWKSFLLDGALTTLWEDILLESNETWMSIDTINEPTGLECFEIREEPLTLTFPFSRVFFEKIRPYKEIFMDEIREMRRDLSNLDEFGELPVSDLEKLTKKYAELIEPIMYGLYDGFNIQQHGNILIRDICNILTRSHEDKLPEELTTRVGLWILLSKTNNNTLYFSIEKQVVQAITILWANEDLIGDVIQLLTFCSQMISIEPSEYLPCGKYENLLPLDKIQVIHKQLTEQSSRQHDATSPEDMFVSKLCTTLLPTQQIFAESPGIDGWYAGINRLLSFSSRVSCLPSELHALRLCNDFATMMDQKEGHLQDTLFQIADYCQKGGLDSPELFEYLLSDINGSSSSFLCQYFRRILDSNSDSYLLDDILKSIVSMLQEKQETPPFVSPVLQCFIAIEDDSNTLSKEYESFLKEEHFKKYPTLTALEKYFQENSEKSEELLVICSDIIHELIFCNLSERFPSGKTGCSELIETFDAAMCILRKSQTPTLHVAIASAFVRSFLTDFSLQVMESRSQLDPFANIQLIADVVGNNIEWQPDRVDSDCRKILQAYIIKTIQQRLHLKMQNLMHRMHDMGPLANAFETPSRDVILQVGYNPISLCSHYNEVHEKLQSDDGNLKSYLTRHINSEEYQLAFMANAFETFFLPGVGGTLKGEEHRIGATLMETVTENNFFKDMMECLTSTKDFHSKGLEQILHHSRAGLQKVTVILSLACILIAKKNTNLSFLGKCFFNPTCLKDDFVPTCSTDYNKVLGSKFPGLPQLPRTFLVELQTCETFPGNSNEQHSHFGQRFCLDEAQINTWPHLAHYDVLDQQMSLSQGQNLPREEKGYHKVSVQAIEDSDQSVRNMHPFAFRIMRILMHGLFLGAVSLGNVSEKDMKKCLGLNSEEESFTEYLIGHIDNDWEVLRRLLDVTDNEVFHVITHLVWILQENLTTKQAESDYHEEFEENISRNIMDKLHQDDDREDFLLQVTKKAKYSSKGIESMVLELGHVQKHIKPKLPLLTLFRELRPKTTASICQQDVIEHPFLQLYLEFQDLLPLVHCIMPILQWHQKSISWGYKVIKRQEAERLSIIKFLNTVDKISIEMDKESERNKNKDTEKADRQKLFEELTYAWDELSKKKKNAYAKDIIGEKMILETHSISDVLLHTDESKPMRLLQILVKIQNDFLDAAVGIATSSNSPALGFLIRKKGVTQLPVIHLQNVQERAIIDMGDENRAKITKVLQNGEWGLQYGKGKFITYDLAKIEKDLANLLLLGRAHLRLDDSFPKFVYADELSLSSPKFLYRISLNIPQKPLTEEIWQAVNQKANDLEYQEDLIHALDTAVFLARRNDTRIDETMEMFTQKWLVGSVCNLSKSMLSDLARGQFRLSHIVALYEYLERRLGGKHINTLPIKFCSPLQEKLKKRLNDLKNDTEWKSQQKVEAFETTLLRHIYRISASNVGPELDEQEPIGRTLAEKMMWPHVVTGRRKEQKLSIVDLKTRLPGSLTMQYLRSTVQHVQSILKVLKNENDVGRFAKPTQARPRRKKEGISIT